MRHYVSHHHQDHFNMPGCNVLCCNTAINAMNRTLNTDMVTISFTPDIFLPWSIIVRAEAQIVPCSCSGVDGFAAVFVVEVFFTRGIA